MLKRNIKFPLIMKNGEQVRTLEELREHFDLENILEYYYNGKLKVWLEDRLYYSELEQLKVLSAIEESGVPRTICSIFDISFTVERNSLAERYMIRKNKIETIKLYTEEIGIIEDIDLVAISQAELEEVLKKDNATKKIYLLGEKFSINDSVGNVEYIGINQPKLKLVSNGKFEAKRHNITFKNLILTSDAVIKVNADKHLFNNNKIDNSIKLSGGFENLTNIIDLEQVNKELNYIGFNYSVKKVFALGNLIGLFADYNPVKVIFFEPDKGEIRKIVGSKESIPAICKDSSGDLYYYYHGQLGKDFSSLLKIDSTSFEEIEAIKNFYVKPNFYEPNILGAFEDTIYSYKYNSSTLFGRRSTWIEYKSYDLISGKEIGAGSVDLPGFYNTYVSGEFTVKQYFHRGYLYSYLPNEQLIYSYKENKQIKLEVDLGDYYLTSLGGNLNEFVICENKLFATTKRQDIFNRIPDGSLLIFDLNSGKEIKIIKAHNNKIESIKEFGDKVVTISADGILKMWNTFDLSLISTLKLEADDYQYIDTYDVDIEDERMIVLFKGKVYIYEL
ncbi:hypothetical protein ACFYKT_18425 [Cytobacillus sp. FJAT-53684]|uniref:WD40 repeat domain-containing protein n=1 Tax=Cytobacillus mangrovibacter TaxID=3299024 RepID=A0ABW6K612_9BACI